MAANVFIISPSYNGNGDGGSDVNILGKLLPSYGAIDCSRKQNGGGHCFLYLHIDGVVLNVAVAKERKSYFTPNQNPWRRK